jgi:hypothetical protein
MLRFHWSLALLTCLLLGCEASRPEAAPTAAAQLRYPGEASLAQLYRKTADGQMQFFCSAGLVALDDQRVPKPGILTASHCFEEVLPDIEGYYASFDDGKTHVKLGLAWLGDRYAAGDIAYVELVLPKAQGAAAPSLPSPLPVTLAPQPLTAGDEVWTWSNPDDQGRALSVGYVMNPRYRKPPIGGTVHGQEVFLDMRGYIVTDLNTAPGSSGGLLLGRNGPIGVNSGEFVHERGFRSAFATPIDRLGPLLSKPGKAL